METFDGRPATKTPRNSHPSCIIVGKDNKRPICAMSEAEMKIDPARASALASQLQGVSERIAAVAKGQTVSSHPHKPWALLTRVFERFAWLRCLN